MSRLPLSPDEQRLLTMARPLQAILRPCVKDHPFRLAGEVTGSTRSQARFSEALVLAMVGRGLITVTQCAKALPVRDDAGAVVGTVDRPFSAILSKEGVAQRAMLIDDRRFTASNDAAVQERAA